MAALAAIAVVLIAAVLVNWLWIGIRDARMPDPCHSLSTYEYATDYDTDVAARTSDASMVVIATVEGIAGERLEPRPVTELRIKVDRALRGNPPSGLTVSHSGVDGCESNPGPIPKVGYSYLMYLWTDDPTPTNGLTVIWYDTVPLSDAQLAAARSNPASVGRLHDAIAEIDRTPYNSGG
ncbi:hypothetical protein [Gordonia sp. (in: high G+C Gram-positive bacteria)]|uniref:hypothetical protein n=1 Tax=Gordonia sp. (in: high G+C Gram-positive bacteria) TaxID=84139 RepID=UPI0039E6B707